jgi:hypothetical protein
MKVRAPSPCQSVVDDADVDRDELPRASVRSPGMPWTTSSSIEMHVDAG